MVKLCLVTTSMECTWPERKDPIVFLGSWCLRYSRKTITSSLDYKVVPYHWDDRSKLFEDYKILDKLYEKLLSELSTVLNKVHGKNQSKRYWRILLGPWLGYFLQGLFDRWFMLTRVLADYEITHCTTVSRSVGELVPTDMKNFVEFFIGDDWNEGVYAELLEIGFHDKIEIFKVDRPVQVNNQRSLKAWVKEKLRSALRLASKFVEPLSKDDDAFFMSSYLPKKVTFFLQLKLGQMPRHYEDVPTPSSKVSPSMREELETNLSRTSSDEFETIASTMIARHLPTSYLEGYQKLTGLVRNLSWPKNPSFIFSSVAYCQSDTFKAWAAEKTSCGVPLIIGQHGGNFGMTPFAFEEKHQIDIADRWVSWGWQDKLEPKIVPFGNFKTLGKLVRYDSRGPALMVQMSLPRYSYHLMAMPIAGQMESYLDDQVTFLRCLSSEIQGQITLRLYPNDYGWDEAQRWGDTFPDIRIAETRIKMEKLIQRSRLYISTYNATTYLESMSLNIPTIVFWNPYHWELKEEVQPLFNLLKRVGIFHDSPSSAARQVMLIWNNIPDWWESPEVQNARVEFCNQFSKMPTKPMNDMLKIVRQAGLN